MLAWYLRYMQTLIEREEGQDLIEYALLVVLITLAGAVGMAAVGTEIATVWQQIINGLSGLL